MTNIITPMQKLLDESQALVESLSGKLAEIDALLQQLKR